MAEQVLVGAVRRQFGAVHKMLREAIENCPEEAWRTGRSPFFAPARLAFHVVQATDFHLSPQPKEFNWNRFELDWEEAPPEKLLGREALLTYFEEVAAMVNRRLEELGDSGLLGPDYQGFFPTALDHVLYTIRHAQHHTGQINAELKLKELKVARWR